VPVDHDELLRRDVTHAELSIGQVDNNGLLLHGARRLGLVRETEGLLRIGIAIGLLAWLPLLILTALDGTLLSGPTIPFRWSLGTHARFLLAIPLFFFAESVFWSRINEVARRLVQVRIVREEDREAFAKAWRQTQTWWSSQTVEIALIVATALSIYLGLRTDLLAGAFTWRTTSDGHLVPAGWWYALVSLPLFQFLLWRWTWRLLVWARFLWVLSRFDLKLTPTHPDGAGGLGSLGVVHVDLSPLAFGCSAMLAASVAEKMLFAGGVISDFVVPLGTSVIGLTAALIAPLFVFSRRLLEVKQLGLVEYGALASRYTTAFEDKWLRGGTGPDERLLGTADLQSLADLGGSVDMIGNMKMVPISFRQILALALSCALPMLPLALFKVPLKDLMTTVIRNLIGV
jgi:hypothetical protein